MCVCVTSSRMSVFVSRWNLLISSVCEETSSWQDSLWHSISKGTPNSPVVTLIASLVLTCTPNRCVIRISWLDSRACHIIWATLSSSLTCEGISTAIRFVGWWHAWKERLLHASSRNHTKLKTRDLIDSFTTSVNHRLCLVCICLGSLCQKKKFTVAIKRIFETYRLDCV